jgi:hypothetical protein
MNLDTVRRVATRPLAESALAAPAAGFGDHELYPDLAVKVAVLLQRVASRVFRTWMPVGWLGVAWRRSAGRSAASGRVLGFVECL